MKFFSKNTFREYFGIICLSIAVTLLLTQGIFQFNNGDLELNNNGVTVFFVCIEFVFFGLGWWCIKKP